VGRYESELRTWLRTKKPELLKEIVEKKELDKAGVIEGKIKAALDEFSATFAG
jgi:F0F1-type ATP synthase alpha subunit